MVFTVRQYFLVPSFDFPTSGVLNLGRIYADPRLLSSPLNPKGPVKIYQKAIIKTMPQNKWSDTVERQNKGMHGFWASFFGINAGLGINFSITGEMTCKAYELRIQTILRSDNRIPTGEHQSPFRRSLY